MRKITLLDGPMGTELARRGVDTRGARWSARALREAPEMVAAVHRDYAQAGAVVHTSNTFRTQRWTVGDDWRALTHTAVALTRGAVPTHHRVAGSIAPLEDCYRPDLSPANAAAEHREMARFLVACGVDLLLVETFPHVGEALGAVQASVATGAPTWCSFTAGWRADLLTVAQVLDGAKRAVDLGAQAILVNCVPAEETAQYLEPLSALGVPFGAYANAGHHDAGIGWGPQDRGPETYCDHAMRWVALGATLLGSCCGTGPQHVDHLAEKLSIDARNPKTDGLVK